MPAAHFQAAPTWRLAVLCAGLAAVVTFILQGWLGFATIYSSELEPKRLMLHEAILTNTPPDKGWAAVGAAALNIRVTVVYAAQALHEWSDLSVARAYWVLDTVFLFAVLAGLPLYLRRWLPDTWCLAGQLYFAAVLPLSYFLHAFQPWDRMQLAAWLLLLVVLRDGRFWACAAVLALSMTIKFDTALVPVLWVLVHWTRERSTRVLLQGAALALVAYATLAALKGAFPAPAEPARFSLQVAMFQVGLNLHEFAQMNLRHPVLLALALPLAFALHGISRRPRFLVAGMLFGALLSCVWFVFTVYAEVRAQLALLLLLLPPALLSLRAWLGPERPTSS